MQSLSRKRQAKAAALANPRREELQVAKLKRPRLRAKRAKRHNSNREALVPVYIGLKVYVEARKKNLIDDLYSLGTSISYYRVMKIAGDTA